MPFSDNLTRLPISTIHVPRAERQRREFTTKDLEASISQIGLINPPVVRRHYNIHQDEHDYFLVAGERRLEACRALGWTEIPVRFAEDLSPIEAAIIELEENIKRTDLPWQDQVRAIARIHALHLRQDPNWTLTETAESISLSLPQLTQYMTVSRVLDDSRIASCGGLREAYNVIVRNQQREMGNALSDLLEDAPQLPSAATSPTQTELIAAIGMPSSDCDVVSEFRPKAFLTIPDDSILCADFLEWASAYSGPKFNLIHCDFPFGIPLYGPQSRGAEHTMYEDNPDLYFQLLEVFCNAFNNFASVSCHVMFWYAARHLPRTAATFARLLPSVEWQVHPLIWLRSDNSGVSPDPRRLPRHIYDTALLGSRGNRQIVLPVADAYSAPGDRSLHPHTKPEPMLRHFFRMLVDEHTTLFDPTAGSGTALRAAESLGATRVLGLEPNTGYCDAARKALKDARTLRRLSGAPQ